MHLAGSAVHDIKLNIYSPAPVMAGKNMHQGNLALFSSSPMPLEKKLSIPSALMAATAYALSGRCFSAFHASPVSKLVLFFGRVIVSVHSQIR